MKKIIFNKYFDSNWSTELGTIIFCSITIYIFFFTDLKLSITIFLSAVSMFLLAKIFYHQHIRKIYFQNIKKTPLRTSTPHSVTDFYEGRKLRTLKKESINKKTDSIIILKTIWRDNIMRYGDFNIYYQIIYYNEKDATELICFKKADVKINDKSFDFENFIKIGENFAFNLDLKHKVVTNL